VLASLLAGIVGGLIRAGVIPPASSGSSWVGPTVVAHAFLMICTFMGTVIGIERAVAVKHSQAFAGPLASGLAGVAMLLGAATAASWLVVAAALAFIVVNVVVVRRQRAAHTVLLLVAAIAWAAGSFLYALEAQAAAVVPWWFSFLVLTIAAERLEMTRLMRRRQRASLALYAIFGVMLIGAALSAVAPTWGGALYGLSLLSLSIWLLCFDIARRTVRAHGLSRYMALCLLLGYVWLFVAGAAWMATSYGLPCRDAALHALALGFVFSMIFAHAPLIVPVVAKIRMSYVPFFHVPVAVLHASLLVRFAAGYEHPAWRLAGGYLHAAAIALFVATLIYAGTRRPAVDERQRPRVPAL